MERRMDKTLSGKRNTGINMKLRLLTASRSTAVAGLDYEVSYDDLYKRAKKLSEALGPDLKKAALFAENSPDWIAACYGIWASGGTLVPVDANSTAEEAAFAVKDSQASVLLASDENFQTAKRALEASGTDARLINISQFFRESEYRDPERGAFLERDEGDLALIVYTSGTTGMPKGVMLTFANMSANMSAVVEAKYYFPKIRVFAMLPFHHILPLMGTVVMPIAIGGKVVIPPSLAPQDLAGTLQKHNVDMVISVPRFYETLHSTIMAKISQSKIASALFSAAKLANNIRVSQFIFSAIHKKFGGSIKFWISGGAALDKKVWSDLYTLGFSLREGYGMTECAPIIAFPRLGNIKMGSPGQPLPGVEVRIVDGEITVKGKNVTSGYYNRPEETAETIRNGWLYTGDLGYIDDDGFIFITGRRKEIIVLANGKNINPAEIEINLQRQCHDILEAGVLMYENTLWAVIRVSPEFVGKLGEEEALEKIRNDGILPYNRGAPSYKRIIKVSLTTDELPRTRVGKLKRHLLAAYVEGKGKLEKKAPLPEPDSQIYAELKAVLEKQISLPMDCDAHMEMDLGLDSLGKISLQCFVKENYGVEISERDFQAYPSLREFAKMVEDNRAADFDGEVKDVSWGEIISKAQEAKIRPPQPLHMLTIWLLRGFSRIFYKVSVSGQENAPEGVRLILAANHQSYIDGIFIVGNSSKRQIYKTYFFAKIRNIIKSGLLRKFADRSNVIIMDINDNVKDSIMKLAKALLLGNRIAIFPEGTRTKDGEIAEFKQTFAILAKETKTPVVPVCISGAYENIPAGKTLPKFGSRISVKYLKEMVPEDGESYQAFADRVRAEIEKNMPDLRRNERADAPESK